MTDELKLAWHYTMFDRAQHIFDSKLTRPSKSKE
jgi:hypothetical protein